MVFGEAKGTAQHARYVGLAGWLLVIEKVQERERERERESAKRVGDVG